MCDARAAESNISSSFLCLQHPIQSSHWWIFLSFISFSAHENRIVFMFGQRERNWRPGLESEFGAAGNDPRNDREIVEHLHIVCVISESCVSAHLPIIIAFYSFYWPHANGEEKKKHIQAIFEYRKLYTKPIEKLRRLLGSILNLKEEKKLHTFMNIEPDHVLIFAIYTDMHELKACKQKTHTHKTQC